MLLKIRSLEMNRAEFDLVKNFTYAEYCEYLKTKYGKVPFKYGSSKNKKPGYFIHHIAEDKVPSLSHPEQKKQYPEYQVPELLVYCDYLEHLLLHIMIGRVADPAEHLGLNGPCRFIIPNLINFYEHGVKQKINELYYSLIERDKDVFELLIAEYNDLVKDIDLVLEHNVSLYAQVEEALDTKGKAHATLGTGLGKTTLALQYVKSHSCRALVVCPNNIVKDSWKGNGHWTVPVTYQTLASKYDPDTDTLNFDLSSYNLVILDEVHHVGYDEESGKGALLWGKAIQKLFDTGIKVLGLTATEIRSDGIDVSEQFFAGCNFEGYSFEKAIEEGIVHPISYVTAVYDWSGVDKELEDLGMKVSYDETYMKLRGQLDVTRQQTPELTTILRASLRVPQSEMRGIAFIQEEADEATVLEILRTAYPGVLLLPINSHMSKQEVEKNKKLFANPETKNTILVAINMVTEGAHYPGINTGIMFRTTESYVLYTQMVGRFSVLTTKPDPHGVIIDLVNNLNRIKYNDRVKDTKKKRYNPDLMKVLGKLEAAKSGQIIVKDYTQNFVERMKELKEYCDDSWEDWEIEILQKYYAAEGPEGCQKRIDEEWELRYPGSLTKE
jgi:superfamily II DNA or RNA helicase